MTVVTQESLDASLNAQNTYNKIIVEAMSSVATIATSTATLTGSSGVSATAAEYAALAATGYFKISIDGAAVTECNPDFTGDASMADVAASLQIATRAAFSDSSTVTWSTDKFVFATGVAGASGAISYITAGTTGVDLSSMLGGRSDSAGVTLLAAGETYSSKALFNVSGKVRVLSIYGKVGTVIETSANATKLTHTPTGGAAGDLCTTLDISADAAASFLYPVAAGSALINSAMGATDLTVPYILDSGKISLVCAASKTGSVTWTVIYQQIESGATVTDCHTS